MIHEVQHDDVAAAEAAYPEWNSRIGLFWLTEPFADVDPYLTVTPRGPATAAWECDSISLPPQEAEDVILNAVRAFYKAVVIDRGVEASASVTTVSGSNAERRRSSRTPVGPVTQGAELVTLRLLVHAAPWRRRAGRRQQLPGVAARRRQGVTAGERGYQFHRITGTGTSRWRQDSSSPAQTGATRALGASTVLDGGRRGWCLRRASSLRSAPPAPLDRAHDPWRNACRAGP